MASETSVHLQLPVVVEFGEYNGEYLQGLQVLVQGSETLVLGKPLNG